MQNPNESFMNDFLTPLDSNPADWDLRLIYSDYLEENEDLDFANTQRWMVMEKRHPMSTMDSYPYWYWGRWVDLSKRGYSGYGGQGACRLYNMIFAELEIEVKFDIGWSSNWKLYSGRDIAERVLCKALLKIGSI